VAIALNTYECSDELARGLIASAERETGLPAADPVREGAEGAGRIASAIVNAPVRAG
jgi:uncharacterized NAD-dependent epimerase/dehydratase family protein